MRWLMRLARPMARGIRRLMILPPFTWMLAMRSLSTSISPPDLSSAFAAALLIA